MTIVENLNYWANYQIKTVDDEPPTTPHQIVEDAAQIISQNFQMAPESTRAMVLAAGRAIGEAGLIVDPYTNAFYQYCLMASEQS